MRWSRDLPAIYVAAFLRALGVGLLGVVLGVYLFRVGLDSTRIGLVIAAGLAGGTVATALVTVRGDRLGRRRVLCWLSLLACAGGLGLAVVPSFGGLLALAFVGMLNGMGTDRSAAFALEQAIIPGLVSDRDRTWTLSWYNVLLDGGGALGALAGALPLIIRSRLGVDLTHAYRAVFFSYAALQLLSTLMYWRLSPSVETPAAGQPTSAKSGQMWGTVSTETPAAGHSTSAPSTPLRRGQMWGAVSTETKTIVGRLAALFGLDAFGGGFLGDALVAYWFFRRFGVDEHTLGVLFFIVHLLNAASHLGAAWLSRRIGLVKTMVFTHLPSSVFLIAVPFAPSMKIAMALFLARESLVEMDVPTRQSYVAAMVKPQERTFASGITNLTRNVSWAAASSLAGALMQHVAFSAPLVLGGSMKIVYDLLLYRGFRHLKAPEEQHTTSDLMPTASGTHERVVRR